MFIYDLNHENYIDIIFEIKLNRSGSHEYVPNSVLLLYNIFPKIFW